MGVSVFSQVWKASDVYHLRGDLGDADRPVLRRSPAWGVDVLSAEGIVSSVTVGRGVLTIFMLGAPDGDGAHPTVCFEFPMSVVRGFSVGERPMLRHVDWREDGGFAYALRFTGSNGEMGADEAAARVREYGGSCWGLDEAVECERALNERLPLTGGKLL